MLKFKKMSTTDPQLEERRGFTDWDGIMAELFNIDNLAPLESPHDSSSGIASDGPHYRSSTSVSTNRGTPSPHHGVPSPRDTPSSGMSAHSGIMEASDMFTPSPHHLKGRGEKLNGYHRESPAPYPDHRNGYPGDQEGRHADRIGYVDRNGYHESPNRHIDRNGYPESPVRHLDRSGYPENRHMDRNGYADNPAKYMDRNGYPDNAGKYVDRNGYAEHSGLYAVDRNGSYYTLDKVPIDKVHPYYARELRSPNHLQRQSPAPRPPSQGHMSPMMGHMSPMIEPVCYSPSLDLMGYYGYPHTAGYPHAQTPSPVFDGNMYFGAKKKRHRLSLFDLCPDDVILKIFQHLPTDQLCRCARVCKRWYTLVWEPSLWTQITINNEIANIDRALKFLTRRLSYNTPHVCIMVEKINMNSCERLTDKGLHLIAKRCPELRHLEIQGCANITNLALFEVVSRCTNLEHLNVTGCALITCISLTPDAKLQYGQNPCTIYLRHLDMTDCYALEDSGLKIIASHCTQLQYMYLRRCMRITDIGVQAIALYCTMLKEFSVSDCRRVTDFGLRELSKLGSSLRYLSVAKCDKVSDVGVKYIAKYCKKLRYLNVRGCEAVSDDALQLLAENCRRLKSLDVGKCDVTDEGLEILAEHCPQLKKLSLKSCDAITDSGVVAIAQKCRHLQQLNIQDCHITVDAYRTVKKLCKRCIIEHTNPGFY
ncbi:F-box/LRR-repeat protein 7-like isoform X1 [Lingula anatina]|uniref:F-box/LRR-repeat protein 7-like isoform X1 n=1 Tax=Lingula anatina TaxID=7574 RepID=A0A1S3HDN6_LINAN|nr:F-box/LRR-repeat protein 7-like isoform X1 [Lingula anatina]|eukprot:XP_013384148.1 F-box/LRR-repeat protein 7-like isoform X1 [Lingula anatina]